MNVAVIGASKKPDRYSFKAVMLYLAPTNQESVVEAIIQSRPKRVIFNPGTENPPFAERLRTAGIEPLEACTLVLLKTRQFEL